jgi:hypothetical protein
MVLYTRTTNVLNVSTERKYAMQSVIPDSVWKSLPKSAWAFLIDPALICSEKGKRQREWVNKVSNWRVRKTPLYHYPKPIMAHSANGGTALIEGAEDFNRLPDHGAAWHLDLASPAGDLLVRSVFVRKEVVS